MFRQLNKLEFILLLKNFERKAQADIKVDFAYIDIRISMILNIFIQLTKSGEIGQIKI